MKTQNLLRLILLLTIVGNVHAADSSDTWPQWRGPMLNGTSATAEPPIEWSETKNVKWKVAVPGSGMSTPIVWNEKVFLLTAVPMGQPASDKAGSQPVHKFIVLCHDRATGKQVWERVVREEAPHEGHHKDHGFASGSPVTDGSVLVAYFGSRGLHCLDMSGVVKWSKDLGKMKTRGVFGEGASPAMRGDVVVAVRDDETEDDCIVAFDKNSGTELWRVKREETTGWTTPLIVEHKGTVQVIVNAANRVRSYNLKDGKEIWQCGGQTQNPIPTPVASQDTVFVTSGFRGSAALAIALGRTGDLTGSDAILWSHSKNTPYVPSPLLTGDYLYLIGGNNPVLTCLDAKTGNAHFEGQRFEGLSGVYASPVSAADRVYVLGRNGTCLVLRKGPKPEVLATNSIGEKTDASIALVGKQIFIRGHQSLFCIEERR
jgi:outer membrane protein assembly factor BamB